jgi:hypothetical protein
VGVGFGYPYAYPYYGYAPYGAYPYGYGGYPAAVYYDNSAAMHLQVTPRNTEVYVDGYYAGIVDDFDGTFQRLNVPPGEHEIELWLEGYRTVRQKVYLTRDNTFKVKYQMEHLPAGEAQEPKPQPLGPPPGARMQPQQQPMGRGPSTYRMPPPPPQEQPQPMPDDPRGGIEAQRGPRTGGFGTLAVKVQPGDAEISIDGEAWRGPGGQDRLTVEVPEGSHTVEIRKSGYRTYVTQVDVRRGQTTPLNVSLRGEQQ